MIYNDKNKINLGQLGIVSKGGSDNDADWANIGYDVPPEAVQKDFEYAKQLKENWKPGDNFFPDEKLGILPVVGSKDEDYSLEQLCHMNRYLYDVSALKYYDFSRVTSLDFAFYMCDGIRNKIIEFNLNAPKCRHLSGIFGKNRVGEECHIEEIDINDFHTAENCDVSGIIGGASGIKSLSINGNLSNISNLNAAFNGCFNLKCIDFDSGLGANMELTEINLQDTKVGMANDERYDRLSFNSLCVNLADRHQIAEEKGIEFKPCQIIINEEVYNSHSGVFNIPQIKMIQQQKGYEMIGLPPREY